MAWNPKGIVAAALLFASAPLLAQSQATEDNWDGLVRVRSDKIELVYLAPEADFRPFTRVLLDPSEMAMRADWLRDQRRRSAGSLASQPSERDIQRGLERGREQFDSYFAEAFTAAGFAIATEPGPDVARISAGVVDIDVIAPDTAVGRTRTFSEEAGSGTLVVEVRDSMSNALLGRAIERRIAGDNGPWLRTAASNRADFDRLFRRWAQATANGLVELKALSPVDVNGERLAR
jgi:hypothetical protein